MNEHDPEYCDRNGALTLAQRIVNYWAARGQSVAVYLERARHTGVMRSARFDIRSDMVDALPRKIEQRDAA